MWGNFRGITIVASLSFILWRIHDSHTSEGLEKAPDALGFRPVHFSKPAFICGLAVVRSLSLARLPISFSGLQSALYNYVPSGPKVTPGDISAGDRDESD